MSVLAFSPGFNSWLEGIATVVGILVGAAILLIAAILLSEWISELRYRDPYEDALDEFDYEDDGDDFGINRAVAMFSFIAEEPVQSLISQVMSDNPVETEVVTSGKARAGAGPASIEGNKQIRQLYKEDQPLEAKCLPLIRHLKAEEKVVSGPDQISCRDYPIPTIHSDPREFVEQILTEKYEDSIDGVTPAEVAAAVADRIEDDEFHLPSGEVERLLIERFEEFAEDESGRFILINDQWHVEELEDQVVLHRTDVRVSYGYSHAFEDSRNSREDMPADTSIVTAKIPKAHLAEHGSGALLGLTRTTRQCVFARFRQYDPTTKTFEISPLMIFSPS